MTVFEERKITVLFIVYSMWWKSEYFMEDNQNKKSTLNVFSKPKNNIW